VVVVVVGSCLCQRMLCIVCAWLVLLLLWLLRFMLLYDVDVVVVVVVVHTGDVACDVVRVCVLYADVVYVVVVRACCSTGRLLL